VKTGNTQPSIFPPSTEEALAILSRVPLGYNFYLGSQKINITREAQNKDYKLNVDLARDFKAELRAPLAAPL
jgi:hypothetical protein